MAGSDDRSAATDATATKPSMRVIERVADAEGVDPWTLDPPLCDAIDPVALDQVIAGIADGSSSCGRVSFQYYGYDLSVDSDGNVDLR